MRILVVEDEKKIADSVKKGLEQETYAVDVAYDGEAGLDLAMTEDYDAIVLDLMLPGIDGLEICKTLREDEISTPILMLTAKSQIEDRVIGLNSGADDYLPKPFAFEELVARIQALTRRPKQSLDTILTCEDLSLNSSSKEVTRNSEHIDLSKKEYALLEYMLRNKEKTVTKEQIISNVWDYDADVLPNTVEVYIGYLRNKIDKPFPKKPSLVQTIRGFGYQLSNSNKP